MDVATCTCERVAQHQKTGVDMHADVPAFNSTADELRSMLAAHRAERHGDVQICPIRRCALAALCAGGHSLTRTECEDALFLPTHVLPSTVWLGVASQFLRVHASITTTVSDAFLWRLSQGDERVFAQVIGRVQMDDEAVLHACFAHTRPDMVLDSVLQSGSATLLHDLFNVEYCGNMFPNLVTAIATRSQLGIWRAVWSHECQKHVRDALYRLLVGQRYSHVAIIIDALAGRGPDDASVVEGDGDGNNDAHDALVRSNALAFRKQVHVVFRTACILAYLTCSTLRDRKRFDGLRRVLERRGSRTVLHTWFHTGALSNELLARLETRTYRTLVDGNGHAQAGYDRDLLCTLVSEADCSACSFCPAILSLTMARSGKHHACLRLSEPCKLVYLLANSLKARRGEILAVCDSTGDVCARRVFSGVALANTIRAVRYNACTTYFVTTHCNLRCIIRCMPLCAYAVDNTFQELVNLTFDRVCVYDDTGSVGAGAESVRAFVSREVSECGGAQLYGRGRREYAMDVVRRQDGVGTAIREAFVALFYLRYAAMLSRGVSSVLCDPSAAGRLSCILHALCFVTRICSLRVCDVRKRGACISSAVVAQHVMLALDPLDVLRDDVRSRYASQFAHHRSGFSKLPRRCRYVVGTYVCTL